MSWPAFKTVWKLAGELSTTQFVVLEILARRVKPHTNTTWPLSIPEITRLSPSCEKAVKKARRELLRGERPLVVFNGSERQRGTYTLAFLAEDGKPALEGIGLGVKRTPDKGDGPSQKAPSGRSKDTQAGGTKTPRLGAQRHPGWGHKDTQIVSAKKKVESRRSGSPAARPSPSEPPRSGPLLVSPEWRAKLERDGTRTLEDADCPKCRHGRDLGWIVVRLFEGKTQCNNCYTDLDVKARDGGPAAEEGNDA